MSQHPAPSPPETIEERIEVIVAAALEEFSSRGFAGASLSAIARRAGVSVDRIRRLFPSKEELFREVVHSTVMASLSPGAAAEGDATGTAVDQVRRFARRYWTTMERPELLALLRLTTAELPRFPELAVFHASEALERFLHLLERIIAGGVARGELRTTDVRASARTVLATLAAHALWFAYPDVYSGVVGYDREQAAAATIEALVRGLDPA